MMVNKGYVDFYFILNQNFVYAFFVVAMVYVPIARRAFGHTISLKIYEVGLKTRAGTFWLFRLTGVKGGGCTTYVSLRLSHNDA